MTNEHATEQKGIFVTRLFDGPVSLVYDTFTKDEHLRRWWGPKGYEMIILEHSLRPGGVFHYRQKSPEGQVMWGKFDYKEIVPNEKLVYTTAFADEEGKTIRAPFSEVWPLYFLNTLTFKDVDGKTELTMSGIPYEAAEAELAFFESFKNNIKGGMAGTLSVLDEYLSKIQRT